MFLWIPSVTAPKLHPSWDEPSPWLSPLEFVVGSRGKGRALDDLPHLLPAEAEVVDGPHVGELHHLDLDGETGALGSASPTLEGQTAPPQL